jgi:hypothetical protein
MKGLMMSSNEKIIYDALTQSYPSSFKSITELSLNSSANKKFIDSTEIGFNFDDINNMHPDCERKEQSPDALFFHDDKLYFIEFKEGQVDKKEIRAKIHEAVLTLYHFCSNNSLLNRHDFFDLDIRYALVYREKSHVENSSVIPLTHINNKYSLKNIEGFVVKKTRLCYKPSDILDLLNKVTSGKVDCIYYYEKNRSFATVYSL